MPPTQPSPDQGTDRPTIRAAKRALRARVAKRRSVRTLAQRTAYATRLAPAVLAHPDVAPVVAARGTVAAYVGVGDEPGTVPLLDALHERGVRALLPVLQPDWSMRWGAFRGAAALLDAPRGLREPGGPYVALADADVVLLPGLAVGADLMRLGRGGGAYDRALADPGVAGRPRLVLLYPDEVGLAVPAEPHDLPVTGWITA